jgi:hypothetical protein
MVIPSTVHGRMCETLLVWVAIADIFLPSLPFEMFAHHSGDRVFPGFPLAFRCSGVKTRWRLASPIFLFLLAFFSAGQA